MTNADQPSQDRLLKHFFEIFLGIKAFEDSLSYDLLKV